MSATAAEFTERLQELQSPEELKKIQRVFKSGAASIMDKQGRSNKTPESRRKELFDLYLRRSDRINNWDLVDLAAPFVVGRYWRDRLRTDPAVFQASPAAQ